MCVPCCVLHVSVLDSTVFNESLPWDQIDQDLACVRSGAPVLAEQLTHSMRLAQALAGCVALQQWDSLATFLSALSQEERAGMVLTPARLAALTLATIADAAMPEAIRSRMAMDLFSIPKDDLIFSDVPTPWR